MKATPETRQRLLIAITAILSPLVFWIVFGLYDHYSLSQRGSPLEPGYLPSEEQKFRNRQFHTALVEYALREDWERVAKMADGTCGKECPPLIFPLQAEAYWRLGRRDIAAQLWSPAYPAFGPAGEADFLAMQGNQERYAKYAQELLQKPNENPNDQAWALLLLPDALKDYTPAVVLAEQALRSAPQRPASGRANALNTLGVALYRARRFQESITKLTESEALQKEPMNTVFLALCHQNLRQGKEARALADHYYSFMHSSLGEESGNRPEHLLFEKELSAILPPLQKATTP